MTTVTVAVAHVNTQDVLATELVLLASVPTELAPFLAWQRSFLLALKPRMIPAPGDDDQLAEVAPIDALLVLVEGRDFAAGSAVARRYLWNGTKDASGNIFAPPAPEPQTQTEALELAKSALIDAIAAVDAAIAKG